MSAPALVLKFDRKTTLDASILNHQSDRFFATPGHAQIIDNHTDHRHGYVLASVEKSPNGQAPCNVLSIRL